MLVSAKSILDEAKQKGVGVGAFNVSELVTTKAAVAAAVKLKTPIILQLTEKTLEFAGDVEIVNLCRNIIEQRSGNVKIALHLDHGRSFKLCHRAVELGFTSIMIDGSGLSFEENKNLTKKVVDCACNKKITVQGELGTVPYLGKHQLSAINGDWEALMTNPDQAEEFVKYTGVDSLAIGIGNAHGFQTEKDVPDWKRLKTIREKLPHTPLILHGASDWTNNKIKTAVEKGITCFNVDTDIRVTFINSLCAFFEKGCSMEDPRRILANIGDAIQRKVEEKIKMFSCKL